MRAEKDLICLDLAGEKRLVSFGSDIPAGWEPVKEANTGSPLNPNVHNSGPLAPVFDAAAAAAKAAEEARQAEEAKAADEARQAEEARQLEAKQAEEARQAAAEEPKVEEAAEEAKADQAVAPSGGSKSRRRRSTPEQEA